MATIIPLQGRIIAALPPLVQPALPLVQPALLVWLALLMQLSAAGTAPAQVQAPDPHPAGEEGFFLDGGIDTGYLSAGGGDSGYLLGRIDLGLRPRGGEGTGAQIGLDQRLISPEGSGQIRLSGAYPALFHNGHMGTLSIGNPRSVTDAGYGGSISFAHSPLIENTLDLAFGSLVQKATLEGRGSFGLRYDGGFGSALAGLSIHRADHAGSEVTTYALAFSLPVTGDTPAEGLSLFGAAERYEGGGRSRNGYTFGAMLANTKLSGQLRYRKTLLAPDAHLYEGRIEYRLSERLSLGLAMAHQSLQGDSSDFFGLGARYALPGQGYLRGSLLKTPDENDPSIDLSVGFRF